MPTLLPKDDNNLPIPALRLKDGGAHHIAVSSSLARNANPFDAATRIVGLYATAPVYLRFGGDGVTASAADHYFPAKIYYDVAIGGDQVGHFTHLAVMAAEGDGVLHISEKI